jgi:hypothetical protein
MPTPIFRASYAGRAITAGSSASVANDKRFMR